MRRLDFAVSEKGFSPDALFAFNVMFMGNETVKAQNFSSMNTISFSPQRAGLYNIEVIIKDKNSLNDIITPFTYIEPDIIYNIDNESEKNDFILSVSRARKSLKINAYKAIINNQKFDFIYFLSAEQRLFVLCPSAIIRERFTLPYFYRWSWANVIKLRLDRRLQS